MQDSVRGVADGFLTSGHQGEEGGTLTRSGNERADHVLAELGIRDVVIPRAGWADPPAAVSAPVDDTCPAQAGAIVSLPSALPSTINLVGTGHERGAG